MHVLGALMFYLVLTASTLVFSLLLTVMILMPYSARWWIVNHYARLIVASCKLFCRLDFKVEGLENLPDNPAIVFAKHQSAWETFALQLFLPPQVWVLKRELMWIPFFGWGLKAMQSIPIDRSSGRKAVQSIIDEGIDRLKKGLWVIIFPEGTRVAPGTDKKFGIGGAVLAEHSGYPVVPVAHNAGEFWGRKSFIKRPGTIRVVIGPSIETQGRSASEINTQAKAWMDDTMQSISEQAA